MNDIEIREWRLLSAIILAGICANPQHRYAARSLVEQAIVLVDDLYEVSKRRESGAP